MIHHYLRRSLVCRHILLRHSLPVFMFCFGFFFSQHKEKTKVIYREPCTDGARSTHKHGKPEVSSSQRFGSFPAALCLHVHLLSWFFISERLNSTEICLCFSPLCQREYDICPMAGPISTETHLSRVWSVTQSYKKGQTGEKKGGGQAAAWTWSMTRHVLSAEGFVGCRTGLMCQKCLSLAYRVWFRFIFSHRCWILIRLSLSCASRSRWFPPTQHVLCNRSEYVLLRAVKLIKRLIRLKTGLPWIHLDLNESTAIIHYYLCLFCRSKTTLERRYFV